MAIYQPTKPAQPQPKQEPKRSILSSAQSLSESTNQTFYKVLLLGESKSGKTTAFRTFPGNADSKLAIGLTPRTRSALTGHPVKLVEIFEQESETKIVRQSSEYSIVPRAWDELWNLIVDLWELAHSKEPFPFESIMLDDLTTAVDYSMNHTLALKKKNGEAVPKGLAGAPAEQHYMPQMTLLARLINRLFLTLPCHILVTGHITFKDNPDTGIAMYYPKVYGNIRESIGSWFDEVYETTRESEKGKVKGGETQYIWKTQAYGLKKFIGSTIGITEDFVVDLSANPCGFSKILQTKTN